MKEHGFDVRVDHRSYEDRGIEIDPQPKLGKKISEMTKRGISREKQSEFDMVRLKNQFRIVKSPEIVFSIVTSNHSTFTEQDIAKVLNRYIDDADQFRILKDRLLGSKEIVPLVTQEGCESVYTTREMLRIEMSLVSRAEALSSGKTHRVDAEIIEEAIAHQNEKLSQYGGLSSDQEAAIRHMLSPDQISCVVGFAGAGKTTSLEAAREGWEKAGYSVLGLAPTGKAARNIEGSGIRAMTLHKFLLAQQEGRERFSEKTVLVLDEAGMVDSRRMSELVSLMEKTGAKGVAMGDGHQLQAVEAGPAFRLLTDRIKPVVLETVVRQQVDWQREAARWFGEGHAAKALSLYQEKGVFTIIPEIQLKEGLSDPNKIVDNYCLARQVSGRIWKEMEAESQPPADGQSPAESHPSADEKAKPEASGALGAYKGKFPNYSHHPDYKLYQEWKGIRQAMVQKIIEGFDGYKVDGRPPVKGGLPDELAARGLDVASFASLAEKYRGGQLNCLNEIRTALRKMSYDNIVDTRVEAKEELVKAWWSDRQDSLHESHLMLAFTNKDANSLNESARGLVRAAGEIKGADYTIAAQRIDTDDFGEEVVTFHDRTFAQGDRILFTRNDNGLKVSNGTLGTILEINRQKMTVVLDGADQRTVSFSPNLYPYLDNGWATTIHKAQGVTVDHVKMLASFEQYRNLSYVGMTRHRYTLQVFGSDLDFWREEKVVDRLSRVQEKLSGFDYLDADKIQEILAEDTAILWHEGKIGKARDLWSAVKVTAKEIYSQVAGSPQQPEGIAEEGYPSFDHTEEKRSTAFFKDGSADFPGEDSSPLKGDNGIREEKGMGMGMGMDPEGKKPDSKAKEGAAEESETFRQSNKPQSEKFREDSPQNPSRKESHSFKGDNGIQEEKGIASEGKEAASQADFPPVPGESQNQGLQKTGSVSAALDGEAEGKATKVGSQGLQGSSPPVTVRENFLSFAEVEDQLRERIVQLAEELLGKPTSRSGDKLRFGKRGSVSVFISGDKQGVYANFESGVKGGPLKLIEEQQGFSSSLEALKWGSQWLGGASFTVEQRTVEKPTSKPSAWKPVIPVPQSAGNPEIKKNKYLNYMLKDGAREVSRHAYRDEHGNLKGYVFRIEKADGSKITPPLSYCENEGGRQAWRWQGFEKDNKTPYGIEKLALDKTRPVLVVEGEKTADAAQKLFPEYHVLTWGGGAGNVDKTNWEPLVGRDVVIWPDNDQGGHKAAETLHNIIACANAGKGKAASVAIVPLPDEIPHKWDLADALPEGWTLDTVKEMAREAIPPKDVTREVVQDDLKRSQSPDSELQKGAEDRIARRIDADGLAHQEGHQTARSYSPQEQEILAYLSTEVAPKKHAWLKEQFADKVLEQAKADPFAALGKWQRVSRDFSFEPSIPDSQMTPQQKEVKDSILGYLHGHVHPDPKRWIRQGDCQDILEMADKKPGDALRAWQNLTRNYDFNPHLDKLSDRETIVYAYLKGKLSDKDARITKSMLESVTVHLLNDPLKAYGEWAQYSHDHTFDPKTGIPVIELKAQDYISALKDQVPQKTLKSWEGKLTQSPETVVQEACEFIKIQEEHEKFKEKLNNAVSRFISLSDIHEKLSPIDPKRHKIGEELRDMAKEHLKDKKFMEGIKDSHNDTAIKRLQEEVRIQHQLKHRELSRGMDMGM